jgi:hypothetical protein
MSLTAGAYLGAAAAYLGFQWTIRTVVYPQLARVGAAEFAGFERAHQRLVARCVGPLFAALVVGAAALAGRPPEGSPPAVAWAGAALTALILGLTAFGAVPQHRALSAGFAARAHRRLLAVDTARLVAAALNTALAAVLLARS